MLPCCWCCDPSRAIAQAGEGGLGSKLRLTLSSTGPWLLFLTFCVYAAQWMAVIGFLPTIYAQAGVTGWTLGVLMALVPAMNIFGNVAAGMLLHRGAQPGSLLIAGFVVMALGSWLAFVGLELSPAVRYGGMLLFSLVGGLVPGTLFALVLYSPSMTSGVLSSNRSSTPFSQRRWRMKSNFGSSTSSPRSRRVKSA